MYVYSLISHRVQQTSQFTPLVLELSLARSHLLWGECSAFSAAIAIHNYPLFVPPGTHHCWVGRGCMIWKACPTPLHMTGRVTRAPVTHPSTNRARRCLTSVIWRELVTTRPCATIWLWFCYLCNYLEDEHPQVETYFKLTRHGLLNLLKGKKPRGDKTSILTHTYPHKPLRKIINDQADTQLFVWLDVWAGDLQA